jgi:hypothetical protein
MRKPALLLTACLWAATSLAQAETYRVDGLRGSDDHDGVQAPFKTIGRALRAMKVSDSLVLTPMPQPYRESITLRIGGTAAQPMVIDGGGATISGADPAPKTGWEEQGGVYRLRQATEVKFLFGPGVRYEQGKIPAELKPEEWQWQAGVLHFRPAAGKTPADYDLEMSVRISGVITNGAGQIIVRNLTAQHFYNDGFNLHGGSAPLWFENIRGIWNGDEGFSAHENSECYVRGAEFSNNYWHGIADVGMARTHYQNIICRDNRSKGVFLIGAMHSISDSEISGSPEQITLSPSDLRTFPHLDQHPHKASLTHLRNVVVRSRPGETGLRVRPGATAVIEHSLLQGGQVALNVEAGATAHVINSILTGAQTAEVVAAGTYLADHNLYHPGRFQIGGTLYTPGDFDRYRQATGNDAKSLIEEPMLDGQTLLVSPQSKAATAAFNTYGFGGPALGPEARGAPVAPTGSQPTPPAPPATPKPPATPAAPPTATPPAAGPGELPVITPPDALAAAPAPAQSTTAEGRAVLKWDFEQANPWTRLYPEPEKNATGEPARGLADLSAAQAHSGQQSGRVLFWLTPPPGGRLKLFSQRLPVDQPVRAVRFWLYGDGSGRQVQLRLRDRSGENFYDAPLKVSWQGWQQVSWDWQQRPPANIAGGDRNQKPDGPTMELVLEISQLPTDAGPLLLYIDDLEIELEG